MTWRDDKALLNQERPIADRSPGNVLDRAGNQIFAGRVIDQPWVDDPKES